MVAKLTLSKRTKKPLAARNELVVENLRLCYKYAHRFVTPGVEYDDLVQAGMMALIEAANGFNNGLGYQFSTYAVTAIIRKFRQCVNQNKGIVHVPHMRRSLASQHQRSIGAETDGGFLDEKQQLMMKRALAAESVGYLSERLKSGDSWTLEDALLDRTEPPAFGQDEIKLLHSYLDKLNERDRRILFMSFGIAPYEEMTLEKIGLAVGISKEGVRQSRNRSIVLLRELMKGTSGDHSHS